uniref:Uncharacterized protein n=1 Tax=Kwoniella dejecticola CBS 10117 TaxID=1296121 RepID=A0A1A5ZVS5_9TREE|nr:uncharacterized protein I303_07821 [Kwoniella dejecticola CBS 10117]OBR81911.1 hypothetical protein I303_07821 [Kwoniella dejecticola CBS 10117]
MPGISVLNPAGMPLDTFRSIPDDYKFALLRASWKSGGVLQTKSNWDEVADEYARVMKEIREPAE